MRSVFTETRTWIFEGLRELLNFLTTTDESLAVIFTPISTEGDVDGSVRRLRWISLDFKL